MTPPSGGSRRRTGCAARGVGRGCGLARRLREQCRVGPQGLDDGHRPAAHDPRDRHAGTGPCRPGRAVIARVLDSACCAVCPGADAERRGARRRLGRIVIASEVFRALGTTAVVATADPAALPEARRILEAEVQAFDDACSRFRPDSELSRAEQARRRAGRGGPAALPRGGGRSRGRASVPAGSSIRPSGPTSAAPAMTVRSRRCCLGDGTRFRPSFEPVAGWRTVELDPDRRAIRIPPRVELDLGATAKALVADGAAGSYGLDPNGVPVGLGGDVAVAGDAPAGRLALADRGRPCRPARRSRAGRSRSPAGASASSGTRRASLDECRR